MKKILVLGGSGFLGQNLVKQLGQDIAVATYCSHTLANGIYFDALTMQLRDIINSPEDFSHAVILLGQIKPDYCATHVVESEALNVTAIKSILQQLNDWNITPIFTSTEVVFDGEKGNYSEDDMPRPLMRYAAQKIAIEQMMRESFTNYLILRISLIYGSPLQSGNLFNQWYESILNNKTIHGATDYFSAPVYVGDVSASIIGLIDATASGTYHIAGERTYSRSELLDCFLAGIPNDLAKKAQVVTCQMQDFNLVEPRPRDVSLSSAKLQADIGIQLKSPTEVLARYFTVSPLGNPELDDSKFYTYSEEGITPAYFTNRDSVIFGDKQIQALKLKAKTLGNQDLRVCLHQTPSAILHQMIILHHKENYYRPHKHPAKFETYHMIEGEVLMLIFSATGEVLEQLIMNVHTQPILQISANTYHGIVVLSEIALFHEIKPGPFIAEIDNEYPPWAPEASNPAAVTSYQELVAKYL